MEIWGYTSMLRAIYIRTWRCLYFQWVKGNSLERHENDGLTGTFVCIDVVSTRARFESKLTFELLAGGSPFLLNCNLTVGFGSQTHFLFGVTLHQKWQHTAISS